MFTLRPRRRPVSLSPSLSLSLSLSPPGRVSDHDRPPLRFIILLSNFSSPNGRRRRPRRRRLANIFPSNRSSDYYFMLPCPRMEDRQIEKEEIIDNIFVSLNNEANYLYKSCYLRSDQEWLLLRKRERICQFFSAGKVYR